MCKRSVPRGLRFAILQKTIRRQMDEYVRETGLTGTQVGVLGELGGHLLHTVLAEDVDSGGDGLLAGGGVVHLARADEGDVRAGAPALAGGGVDLAADGCNIFSDRHGLKTSFHSVFIQMPGRYSMTLPGSMSLAVTTTSSPARRMAEPSALFDARTSVYPSP
mgnify:CR=1 FL=1